MHQRSIAFFHLLVVVMASNITTLWADDIVTVCNPMDLSYRYQPYNPSGREAADPTVIRFKGTYYLFASKSGGYWHSQDLATWTFIQTDAIPTEEYAPTAIVLGDTVYFLASSRHTSRVYQSKDPLTGQWDIACEALDEPVWDPAFFLDDDERLYHHYMVYADTEVTIRSLNRHQNYVYTMEAFNENGIIQSEMVIAD